MEGPWAYLKEAIAQDKRCGRYYADDDTSDHFAALSAPSGRPAGRRPGPALRAAL